MICSYCGLETEREGDHETQQQCREALREKVSDLAREIREFQEEILAIPASVGETYADKLMELTIFRDRLLQVNEFLGAIDSAKKLGTRRAWDRALRAIESWASEIDRSGNPDGETLPE